MQRLSDIYGVAQFISIYRWLQLVRKDQSAPFEHAPFCTPWARKRSRVAQRFHQYLRATNCEKLSGGVLIAERHSSAARPAGRTLNLGRRHAGPVCCNSWFGQIIDDVPFDRKRRSISAGRRLYPSSVTL